MHRNRSFIDVVNHRRNATRFCLFFRLHKQKRKSAFCTTIKWNDQVSIARYYSREHVCRSVEVSIAVTLCSKMRRIGKQWQIFGSSKFYKNYVSLLNNIIDIFIVLFIIAVILKIQYRYVKKFCNL